MPTPQPPKTAPPPEIEAPAPERPPGRMRRLWQRLWTVLNQDVWDTELGALSRARRFVYRFVRVTQLVLRGFRQDECPLHASSLTFLTMLAIIPVLALALSMARVFGAGDLARDQLKLVAREWVASVPAPATSAGDVVDANADLPMDDVTSSPDATDADAARTLSDDVPADAALADGALADGALADAVLADAALADAVLADAVLADGALAATPAEDATDAANGGAHAELISFERIEKLIDLGFERIENLNFRALGGLGVAFLLWSVIGVLGKVEAAFNRVWGVTEHRPLLRKFTDYLSVLIVVPFLLTAASSIPASEAVTRLMHAGGGAVVSHIAGLRALRVLGVIALMTLSYAFLLRFVPHTRVHTRPALVGGFVTAILALAWLRICTVFQVSVAKNSVFFGSFATVPILLSWVYVSWEILLLGAEVSFAVQNADTYRMEQGANKASPRTRLIMAVELLAETARQIRHGDGLLRMAEYLRRRNLSVRLVNDVVRELVQRGFLAEVSDQRGHFAARRDLLNLTVGETVDELLNTGISPAEVGIPPTAGEILRESLSTTLLANLSQRVADLPPPSHDPTAQAETA